MANVNWRRITALRVVVGLTIWFTAIDVLVLTLPGSHLDQFQMFEAIAIIVEYLFFILMPLRWVLILTILIREVRARPLRGLPRTPLVQIPLVTVLQALLGVLSLVGWLAMLTTNTRSDRILGVVVHTLFPALMVVFLVRRSKRGTP